MGNWFTDGLDQIGDGIATGLEATTRGINVVDRYINPFHQEFDPEGTPDESGNAPLGNWLGSSTERFFQAYEYVYDNAISQPVSTAALMLWRPDKYFSASEWSRTWRAAEHISPGQAMQVPFAEGNALQQLTAISPVGIAGTVAGLWGDSENAQKAVDSPLRYYQPPASALPADWDLLSEEEQQQILKDAGMPVDPSGGNAYIASLRDQSMGFRTYSGVNDFALRWYADPFVVAGKAYRTAREARTRPTRPTAGWSGEQIDRLVSRSRTSDLIKFLDENRGNPALVNNTDMALRSAMGPRLGAINEVLTSANEVRDFIRVGMGDVAAQERLSSANALARVRIEADSTRLAAIDLMHARYAASRDPRMLGLVEREQARLQNAINADSAMVNRYETILAHADEIDQLHLSRSQYRAARNRTEAQRAYIAGPARDRRAPRQFRATVEPVVRRADQEPIRVQSGFQTTRLWGVGDFFTTPVTLVRAFKNSHPNGYLELDNARAFEQGNINELRAQLARIPGMSGGQRQNILNQYLRTTSEGARKNFLDDMGRVAASRIAEKYGLDAEAGREIFEATRLRRQGELDNMQQFSAAQGPDGLRVDAFELEGGIKIAPNTVSRLANNYVLDDLAAFDRVLRRNASTFKALREAGGNGKDWILRAGDTLNQWWKFGTLFRLGYIPRVVGDDIASQWARLGTVAMAMRVGYGVNNTITNLAHRSRRGMDELQANTSERGLGYADEELALLRPELDRMRSVVARDRAARSGELTRAQRNLQRAQERAANLPADATPAARSAMNTFVTRREQQLAQAQMRAEDPSSQGRMTRLSELEGQALQLQTFRDMLSAQVNDLRTRNQKVFQGSKPVRIGNMQYPAAFGGQRGEYWMQRISPETAYDQLFKTNQQMIHTNLMRSFDNGARPISAIDDEAKHARAWSHAINAEIAGDRMQRMLVQGMAPEEVVRWLRRDPAGKAYWRRLGVAEMSTPEDIVARAQHEVDEYLPLAEIRQQALTPEGVTPEFLRKAMPKAQTRPTVHMANVGASGNLQGYQAMNRVMQAWYNAAVNVPSRTLSRHPLYNQLYEGHLKQVVNQRTRQGAQPRTVEEVERTAETARRLAERDMKRLVFDISHRSDVSAALRFVSPFFSATAESFQRWARVIGDRPEVLGYAAKFYNAPAYLGRLQTADGNDIYADGTYIDPVTGERVTADKNDRWIVARLPEWVVESPIGIALGAERSSGNMMLSQNSINMVTQGDPWFSPGVGPIVQIPVQEFVKDKPNEAELARHLGILPFGPSTNPNPLMRVAQGAAPSTLRNFLTAFDTSDYRYQQIKMQIMQRAIFEHEVGGKPMLSDQEIADQARNYWLFSAASSFVQPAATQRKDAYEFYRDQYRNLQRANPETADIEFLNKFGEEYFIFAQSMSKNEAGIPATEKAVQLSQQYADILAENPELGSLIIGPEGNGPFSPEAYAYQLNTPITPGDSESQRRRMSASEALAENQRRLGWAKYTAFMNGLTNQLVQRGLNSFEEEGAEDLALQRQAWVTLMAEPEINGEANPWYNEEFSKDWYSFDARKYERLIPALDRVSQEILERDPGRTDLQTLRTYLAGREAISTALEGREYKTLGAQANEDLRRAWAAFVGTLTEADTTFGDLHSRYLARDLGIDIDEEMALMDQIEAVA